MRRTHDTWKVVAGGFVAAAVVVAAIVYGLPPGAADASPLAQSPSGSTQLLFEQALTDNASRQLDVSSAADIRLVAHGLNCPNGATFRVALYISSSAGPTLLDQTSASCSDGITKTYENVVAMKVDVVVTGRQLVDGTTGSFPVDVAILGRS